MKLKVCLFPGETSTELNYAARRKPHSVDDFFDREPVPADRVGEIDGRRPSAFVPCGEQIRRIVGDVRAVPRAHGGFCAGRKTGETCVVKRLAVIGVSNTNAAGTAVEIGDRHNCTVRSKP